MVINNIWSNKKYVNIVINVLLFLAAINIFHYGQVLLPIICLILFIDNKFKFQVNKWSTFIVLCLFGLTFCLFSYSYDPFYSIMGFSIPMSYYIGSNIKNNSETNIKKVIYLIAFGMATHVVLNFIYDFSLNGIELFNGYVHKDIWTQAKIVATTTASNIILLIGCFYYLLIFETNKKYKYIGIILFVLCMIYNIGLGRRTPVLMFAIICFASVIFDLFIYKRNNGIPKQLIKFGFILLIIAVLILLVYFLNIFNLREIINNLQIVKKFAWLGLKAERLEIAIAAIKEAPYHLWGQREISIITGTEVHDLWLDTYDYAGIIPFILIVYYSIHSLINSYRISKNNNLSKEFRLLIIAVTLCAMFEFILEPVISSLSLLLACVVLIEATLERKIVNE